MGVPRSQELKKRRNRYIKLAKLRKMYKTARNQDERSRLVDKATRVSPGLTAEAFLAPLGRG